MEGVNCALAVAGRGAAVAGRGAAASWPARPSRVFGDHALVRKHRALTQLQESGLKLRDAATLALYLYLL